MGTTAIVQGSAEKRELSWRSKSEREAPKSKIERSPSSKAANVDV